MASPTPTSSFHQIAHTTELLELILLALPHPTLLATAPRVCRHWRAVIASSLPLQRALFFAPIAERGPLLPLLPPGDNSGASTPPGPSDGAHDGAGREEQERPAPNTLLIKKLRLGHYEAPDAEFDGGYMPMISMRWLVRVLGGASEEGRQGEEGPEESWKRMYLTQPPARRIEVLIDGTDMFQPVRGWVQDEGGVTAGTVWKKCVEMVAGRAWGKRSMCWFFEL
ncbi:hypothetical protein B0J12DRAFT_70957 [Macrophomina phaseolina]|uniref:F-box domain-containing protein n=1 Tax=Macrophomina phaseolina TaxID=35725 RepID=A0ABQ8GDE5_9PEZI|nr:hypothetical protein B0J12DRAFT_70957 [Macrophomina phaseolina]